MSDLGMRKYRAAVEEGVFDTAESDEPEQPKIPCSKCGEPTTWDVTYGDLCFRCLRADNE